MKPTTFNSTPESKRRHDGCEALLSHIIGMAEGTGVSYQEIKDSFTLDKNDTGDRAAIMRAVSLAQRRHGVLVHNVRGYGYIATKPVEVNGQVDSRLRRIGKGIRRTTKYVNACLDARYYNKLDREGQKELFRKAAVLGALDLSRAIANAPVGELPKRSEARKIRLPEVPR